MKSRETQIQTQNPSKIGFRIRFRLVVATPCKRGHISFGSCEIIANQIQEKFGKELKLKNFFPLNSFGPGYKIH